MSTAALFEDWIQQVWLYHNNLHGLVRVNERDSTRTHGLTTADQVLQLQQNSSNWNPRKDCDALGLSDSALPFSES